LPLVLDLAVAGEMDAVTAATYLAKAMVDLDNGAESVTVRLGQASMKFSNLAELMERVGGAAEAAMSPTELLGNTLGDLAEEIGGVLTPAINDLLKNSIIPTVEKIIEWVKLNPDLIKGIGLVAVGLLAGGGLIFAMSMLAKAIAAVNTALIILQSLTGAGLIKVAIGVVGALATMGAVNEMMKSTPIPEIPGHAAGGIVTSPQLAMVGEAGPEAIIPLGKMGGMGNSVTVNVGNYLGDEISRRDLVRDIKLILDEENRRLITPATRTDYYSVGGHL
jgi:hypothetical protein